MSGLNQYGSCNLYAKHESAKDIKYNGNHYVVLENGARLFLTKEAYRKKKWVQDVTPFIKLLLNPQIRTPELNLIKKGSKKSCFFVTKKECRLRNKNKKSKM